MEAAEVLALAARNDKRTVGTEDVRLWCTVLTQKGITKPEAMQGVLDHIAGHADTYLDVGHVVAAVRLRRRRALEQSSRLEAEALARVDPDDPHAVIQALKDARWSARVRPDLVPQRPALPSRYEGGSERARRAHTGAARCRAALEAASRARPTSPRENRDGAEPSESELVHRTALDRARRERNTT